MSPSFVLGLYCFSLPYPCSQLLYTQSGGIHLNFQVVGRIWQWGATGLLPEATIQAVPPMTKSAEKIPMFLNAEPLYTLDLHHPCGPILWTSFTGSVSQGYQLNSSGRAILTGRAMLHENVRVLLSGP